MAPEIQFLLSIIQILGVKKELNNPKRVKLFLNRYLIHLKLGLFVFITFHYLLQFPGPPVVRLIDPAPQTGLFFTDPVASFINDLKVPSEAIKNFNEEAVFNIIGNTVNNHDQAAFFNYYPTFNPIDKVVELFEENKRLYQELLASEREKIEILKNSK
jgi:xanthosine utilization system XapX-like protein